MSQKQAACDCSKSLKMSFPKAQLTRLFDKVGSNVPGPGHYNPTGAKTAVPSSFAKSKRFVVGKSEDQNSTCVCPHSSHKNLNQTSKRCLKHDTTARKIFASSSSSTRPVRKIVPPETNTKPIEERTDQKTVHPPSDPPQNLNALLSAVSSDEDVHRSSPPSPFPTVDTEDGPSENQTKTQLLYGDALQTAEESPNEESLSEDYPESSPVFIINREEPESESSCAEDVAENSIQNLPALSADKAQSTEDKQKDVQVEESESAKSIMMNEAEKEKILALRRKIEHSQMTLQRMKEHAALIEKERDDKLELLQKMQKDRDEVVVKVQEIETQRIRMTKREAEVIRQIEEYQGEILMAKAKKDRFRELVLSLQPDLQHLRVNGSASSVVSLTRDVQSAQKIFTELVGQRNASQKIKQTKYYVDACAKMNKDCEMSAKIKIMQKQIAAAKEALEELAALAEE